MPILNQGGHAIDYLDEGQGPAVILVHSSASGYGQWRRLVEVLQPHWRVLAPNLFGNGDTSPWPAGRPQTVGDQAGPVLALAELPGVAGAPVRLVGHSTGGAIVMTAALALGPRVACQVLLEPNPFALLAAHGRTEAFQEALAMRDWVKEHGDRNDWPRVCEHFADYWNGPGTWAAMNERQRARMVAQIPSNYHEWDAVLADRTPVEAWGSLAPRTLLVSAADTVRPIREIVEILSGAWRGVHHVTLPEGGHMAPVSRPELVNPHVVAFLESHR